ncbi:MAG TPA: ABC transporter permease [bacterium]
MTRLLATVRCDMRLQFRNGFYYAAAFVAVVVVFLLRWLPNSNFSSWLPALVFSNLLVNNFYFMGGLVLLEKEQGTLEAQIVTPLRVGEYLASKIITLSALSLVENFLIVVSSVGFAFQLLPFVFGIAATSVHYALCGFIVVVRYDSINEYLLPSVVYTSLLQLPLLHYFSLWSTPAFYLHPLQAPLILLKAAFIPLSGWALVYGWLYSAVWGVILYGFCGSVFYRFVIAKAGVR